MCGYIESQKRSFDEEVMILIRFGEFYKNHDGMVESHHSKVAWCDTLFQTIKGGVWRPNFHAPLFLSKEFISHARAFWSLMIRLLFL